MTTLKAEKRSKDVKAKRLRREGYVTGNLRFDGERNPVKTVTMLEIVKDDSGALTTVYKTSIEPDA